MKHEEAQQERPLHRITSRIAKPAGDETIRTIISPPASKTKFAGWSLAHGGLCFRNPANQKSTTFSAFTMNAQQILDVSAAHDASPAVIIEADRIRAFGEVAPGNTFVLVTNSRLAQSFRIHSEGKYARSIVLCYDGDAPLSQRFGNEIPEYSHVLTVLPDCLLHSLPRDVLSKHKLLIMACRSGQLGLDGIQHFLGCGYETDIEAQEEFAAEFFAKGERSRRLVLQNLQHDTSCYFDHLDEAYEWHEQTGTLNWGDQQVFPSGEIACFAVPLYVESLEAASLVRLNGTVALSGPAIVQSGPPSFQLRDQLRIYEKLASLRCAPVILELKDGVVTAHRATCGAGRPAEEMLTALFEVDSRYRNVYEIGFSINEQVQLWNGNAAMNEVWGSGGGNLHLGLGMLPHTQYHLDMFCVNTHVENECGEVLFGARALSNHQQGLRRVKSAACPCLST